LQSALLKAGAGSNGAVVKTKKHAYVLATVFLGLLWPSFAISWSGKVVGVISPHELTVQQKSGSQERVRLYGIDSPQPPQVFGGEAERYVKAKVLGKYVEVQPLVRDQFDRLISYVYIDGQSLTEDLIRSGYAWWYRKYVPWEVGLGKMEEEARKAKLGLWADPAPVPPWEFRDSKPTDETAAPQTPYTIGRKGSVRDRIIQEVGPSKRILGNRGAILGDIRRSVGPAATEPPVPRLPNVEEVSRSVNRILKRDKVHTTP